jgi:hypothetical protein
MADWFLRPDKQDASSRIDALKGRPNTQVQALGLAGMDFRARCLADKADWAVQDRPRIR